MADPSTLPSSAKEIMASSSAVSIFRMRAIMQCFLCQQFSRFIPLIGFAQFIQQGENVFDPYLPAPFKRAEWIVCAEFHGNIDFIFCAHSLRHGEISLVNDLGYYSCRNKSRFIYNPPGFFIQKRKNFLCLRFYVFIATASFGEGAFQKTGPGIEPDKRRFHFLQRSDNRIYNYWFG